MSDRVKIPINIAGQEFKIAPPGGDEERLQKAAALVDKKIAEMQRAGVSTTLRASLLAGLELALDHVTRKGKQQAMSDAEFEMARERLESLIDHLDQALEDK